MSGETPGQAARDALESIVTAWLEEAEPRPGDTQGQLISRHALGACADELARFLANHPHGALAAEQQPQPVPEQSESVECEACGLHRPPTSAEMSAAGPCPGCESLRRQCSELAGEVGALAGALTDIRDANPDAPAGGYATERARITLDALHGSKLLEAGTVPLARHADYIRANQQLALSLYEATEPLLHGTVDEQKLGRELRERHGLET